MKQKIEPNIRQGNSNEKCSKCGKSLDKKQAYIKPKGFLIKVLALQRAYCSKACFNAAFNR